MKEETCKSEYFWRKDATASSLTKNIGVTYNKEALISVAIRLFPFCAMGNFGTLEWESAVPAEVSTSHFSSNQKNDFLQIWLLSTALSGNAHLEEILLENHFMFVVSSASNIIKVVSACYELIICKRTLNVNFNAN